ncbi:enkurin-like [Zootermopsis nevadensis]|nr:enkurin-like [Zootermopsis nevadensis]XP_021913814.1 enkurin-like [Zootermopsis nevadensis]XP_021913815.1 enkurin-like [Zootermopsis nevadensis]
MARYTEEQALEDKEEGMEAKHDVKQNEHSLKDKRKNGHNYCYQNIEKAKKLVPRQPTRNYVDTKMGDTNVLQSSGMETHFVLKKAFGKIPSYLHHRQLHVQASKKKIQEEIKQLKPEGHYITESQRKALLQGLKHNWEELQKTYQQLPIITDTIPKKKYKIKLEEELKQLESDIKTIERHKHIYVTDADSSEFSYNLDSE